MHHDEVAKTRTALAPVSVTTESPQPRTGNCKGGSSGPPSIALSPNPYIPRG
jgi:hypothetical protein